MEEIKINKEEIFEALKLLSEYMKGINTCDENLIKVYEWFFDKLHTK